MKPPGILALFLLLCSLLATGLAAEFEIGTQLIDGKFSNLPAGVQPSPGQLSFVVDYAGENDGLVWLYLINGSQETVTLPAQDSDVYSKRESRNDKQG